MVGRGFFGEEVEEVPLGHQRDIGLREAQPFEHSEFAEAANGAVGVEGDTVDLCVRQAKELDDNPSSSMIRRVLGCTVSPRKSRRNSLCFSRTTTRPGAGQQERIDQASGTASGNTDLGRSIICVMVLIVDVYRPACRFDTACKMRSFAEFRRAKRLSLRKRPDARRE